MIPMVCMPRKISWVIGCVSLLLVVGCATPMPTGSAPGRNSPQVQAPTGPEEKVAPTAPDDEKDKKLK